MTREEAIKRLEVVRTNALIQKANGASEYWQEEIDGTIEAIDMAIEALQTEAVQGEWKPFDLTWGRNVYFCTACQESTEVPTVNGQPSYNFCPNCGAKVTKGGDSE